MSLFQIDAFVPQDGNVLINLPEEFRGKNVKLAAAADSAEDDVFTLFCKHFSSKDFSHISDEDYIKGIRSLRGILAEPIDYSDIRDETDREI
jgi:hypothetical protein